MLFIGADINDYETSVYKKTSLIPDSINLGKMTKEQFNSKMKKSYKEMLEGKGCTAKKILTNYLVGN